MAVTLSGQDSVSPGGMQNGKSVYAGYGLGSFTNMGSVESRFPGKRYVSISPRVASGVDCLDIETGDAVPSDGPAFVHDWHQVNTNKPVLYANASTMPAVKSHLASAGLTGRAYLWVAEWDGSPSIPGGYDAKQYGSTSGYDADSFYDYMFGPVTPVTPFPLQQGSSSPEVKNVQSWLNKVATQIGLTVPLVADGSFGAATKTAVELFQARYGKPVALPSGTVNAAYYVGIEHTASGSSGPPPVAPENLLCAPVTGLKLDAEGPHSYRIEFSYAKQGVVPAAKFEVAACVGSHLGPLAGTYPRTVTYVATGKYTQQFGGIDTRSGAHLIAVRALSADGHHASPWETVLLPKK